MERRLKYEGYTGFYNREHSGKMLRFMLPIPGALIHQAMYSAVDLLIVGKFFRGIGDSSIPLIFVSIACVENIIGDLVLVAELGMNVAGAAIATVGAQAAREFVCVRHRRSSAA